MVVIQLLKREVRTLRNNNLTIKSVIMKKRVIFIICISFIAISLKSQNDTQQLQPSDLNALNNALKKDTLFAQIVQRFGDPVRLYLDYKTKVHNSDSIWNADQKNLKCFDKTGYTERFEMLPLIDWFTKDESLVGEAGVSYLIRTDEATILFDVGLNSKNSDPSLLLHNMDRLGISLDEIDIIFISHNHGDHVGGNQWTNQPTFSLTKNQIDLGEKKVYTPTPMEYPGLKPIFSREPIKIAKGVTTIGVIPCPMFFTDIGEQALAINVKNKGIIIISGCGHQTIEKLVLRSELLFNEDIYGLLGGFHLPVTVCRNIGKIYQYGITDRPPWDPLSVKDIQKNIDFLKTHGIKIVGVSGHDSCDESINIFKNAYKNNYYDIIVGKKITLNGQ